MYIYIFSKDVCRELYLIVYKNYLVALMLQEINELRDFMLPGNKTKIFGITKPKLEIRHRIFSGTCMTTSTTNFVCLYGLPITQLPNQNSQDHG